MSQIVEKVSYLPMLKNPSTKFLAQDPDEDDFLNLMGEFIVKRSCLVKFS